MTSALALVLASLNVCPVHMEGLKNKDLGLEGACREVCSCVVCLSIVHSAPVRCLVSYRCQSKNCALVRLLKIESHVVKGQQVEEIRHASLPAKNGAYRDEDGPEATDGLDQLPCMQTPSGTVSPTSLSSPCAAQEPTVPGPSSPLASLPSTFGSTLLLNCSSRKARSSLIFMIARSRRTLLILASSFAASTSFKRRLSWMHFL